MGLVGAKPNPERIAGDSAGFLPRN